MKMLIKRLNKSRLSLPSYATENSAGMDLMANIEESYILHPFERTLVPTGISISLPKETEAQIRPRSGLAHKNGITVLNSPGTIDSDYRGEIKVLLVNLGKEAFTIEKGMRIAQMVISPVIKAEIKLVASLSDTERGDGGFGSTGA